MDKIGPNAAHWAKVLVIRVQVLRLFANIPRVLLGKVMRDYVHRQCADTVLGFVRHFAKGSMMISVNAFPIMAFDRHLSQVSLSQGVFVAVFIYPKP